MGKIRTHSHWGLDYINVTLVQNRNAGGILVAVLDGGMDVRNDVFAGNVWSDSKAVSKIAGTIPRVDEHSKESLGIDFTDPENLVPFSLPDRLEPYHATQVASIIGGRPVLGSYHGGLAHSVKMMPLKIQPAHPEFVVEAIYKAVKFAISQKVHILNCSWIIYGQDKRLKSVFEEAIENGVLIVAAAGNDDEQLENYPGYPAALRSRSLITVGAVQSDIIDHLSPASNYGSLVDIAAPGDGGLYVGPHKRQSNPPGKTSFAAAYVSGAAALVWSEVIEREMPHHQQAEMVKEFILSGGRQVAPRIETGDYSPRIKTWGISNPILDMRFLASK